MKPTRVTVNLRQVNAEDTGRPQPRVRWAHVSEEALRTSPREDTADMVKILRQLSPKELEVLALIGEDLTDKELALTLGISRNTVRSYIERIRNKVGLGNRRGLRNIVSQTGLRPDWKLFDTSRYIRFQTEKMITEFHQGLERTQLVHEIPEAPQVSAHESTKITGSDPEGDAPRLF